MRNKSALRPRNLSVERTGSHELLSPQLHLCLDIGLGIKKSSVEGSM